MSVTRREFLGYAAASLAAGNLVRRPLGITSASGGGAMILGQHCAIAESAAGYEAAFRAIPCARGEIVVAPAVIETSKTTIRCVRDRLDAGATVILESGAIFESKQSSAFRSHRAMLRDEFGLLVGAPIALWPTHGIPYIEYCWPRAALVRDYSRAMPVSPEAWRIAAVVGDTPVGLARRVGRGLLIFLGAPLGPALWLGDPAAYAWVSSVAKRAVTSFREPA